MKKTRQLLSLLVLALLTTSSMFAQAPDSLFIVGSATPIGWSIDKAIELRINPDNPDQFFYDGPLYPGEFKFPVNRNTDWGQDMYMKDEANEGHFYLHIGGEDDDIKWEIAEGEESRYHIVLDFSDLSIEIIKVITPPAPEALFIVGDASPNGWDISQAVELTKNPDNAEQYIYEGPLSPGDFKFPVNRNTDWAQDMYMRDTLIEGSFYHHIGGAPDDYKWTIGADEGGTYKIVLDFKTLAISIKKIIETSAPESLFIVGSATPIGWSIDQAIELTKDPDNSNIFTYMGILVPGQFKFPVNRNTDWQQDMFMKDTANEGHFYHHIGGEPDDVSWEIPEGDSGKYYIVLDFVTMTIEITKLGATPDALYIFGSATEVGWKVDQSIELTRNPENPNQFIFDGKLIAGEFKFPVNRQSDFGQDMMMKDTVNEGHFYHHIGGGEDDVKWVIAEGEEGLYHIVLDFTDMTIEITAVSGVPEALYIVGSATPIGWNIGQAIELSVNPDNAYQFIYDGTLVPGEFKFPVNRNSDWAQDMYMKDTINEGKFYLHTGGEPDDHKWVIAEGEGGTYRVVLDFSNYTIEISNLTSNESMLSGYSRFTVYPNPAAEFITIDLGEVETAELVIYSVDGRKVYQAILESSTTTIDLNLVDASGLLLLQISSGQNSEIVRVLVR
ncbi:MAG: SusF/SusE family outer membrane protein [Bacteroidales bacterium]